MLPKNKGPHISYTLVPSSLIRFRARIRFAFSLENTRALTITPEITAIAKSKKTVIDETNISTNTSVFGILLIILKLDHAKVPITTINITPTNAEIGTCSISPDAKRIKPSSASAATIPERRPLPPPLILIIDCPIIAQPPIPPNNPVRIFAPP